MRNVTWFRRSPYTESEDGVIRLAESPHTRNLRKVVLEQLLFKIKTFLIINLVLSLHTGLYFQINQQLQTCLLDLSVQVRCVSFTSSNTSWENQGEIRSRFYSHGFHMKSKSQKAKIFFKNKSTLKSQKLGHTVSLYSSGFIYGIYNNKDITVSSQSAVSLLTSMKF